MHLIYVDDSKDNKLACFSALLVPEATWNDCLNRLIAIRRTMKDTDGVPLRMELHATDWVAGKGQRVRHLVQRLVSHEAAFAADVLAHDWYDVGNRVTVSME
jgi:hypothetical protein